MHLYHYIDRDNETCIEFRVHFRSTLLEQAYCGDQYEPPHGAIYEHEFSHVELLDPTDPPLSDAELQSVREWFLLPVQQEDCDYIARQEEYA